MKKFLIGLVAGFLLAALTGVILFFATLRLGERTPTVPTDGLLVLRLGGEMPEIAPPQMPLPWLESQTPLTVTEIWDVLRKAEKDARIKAVLLEPRNLAVGWGKLEEIRVGLDKIRRAGKPLIAYLHGPTAREYYLATAAERIYFAPEDWLDLKGLRAELTYFRGTLDKIGVQLEVEAAGKYKDAGDTFTRTSMRPETREVMNAVVDGVYGHLVETIAAGRKRPLAEIRSLMDEGPFLAPRAVSAGLVDGLLYRSQLSEEIKKRAGGKELGRVSVRDYARVPAAAAGLEGKTKVALLIGEGSILRGSGTDPFGDVEGIRSTPFSRLLRQVADDATIRGVVLRVNSPGGDAIASDEILEEVRNLSRKKPLVISMSDLAASGGYYISMSGDPIVAYANTFTGSIGVLYGKLNLQGLYAKLGMTTETVSRGRHAEIDATFKPLDEAGRRKLREGVDHVYRTFLDRVAQGRKRKTEEVEPLAQGRVWLGAEGKRNGLIDEVGGLDRAFELLRERLKVAKGENLRVQVFPRRRSLLEELFSVAEESGVRTRRRGALRPWLEQLGLEQFDPELWSQGGYLRIAPYQIVVR